LGDAARNANTASNFNLLGQCGPFLVFPNSDSPRYVKVERTAAGIVLYTGFIDARP